MALSLTWNLRQQRLGVHKIAEQEARTIVGMDLSFRSWLIDSGGVYAPATKEAPPNPHLSLPERDIRTPSGRRLTLLTHDSLMHRLRALRSRSGLPYTVAKSLSPLDPAHSLDGWERQALTELRGGREEAAAVVQDEHGARLRFMGAFRSEAACFNCHGREMAQPGAVHGGIVSDIPLGPLEKSGRGELAALALGHLLIWLLGLLGIWFGYRRLSLAQAQLQEGESRLRAIFDAVPDGILAADARTKRFVLSNPGIRRLFGYTEEEFKSLGVVDIHPQASLPRVVAEFEAQARGEKRLSLDLPCLRKDGTVFHADITSAAVVFAGNKVLLGIFRDNVERKRNETLTAVLGHLLQLSLKDISLAELLDLSLEEILDIPGIALQRKGAIFLVESDPKALVMSAQRNLGREVLAACARVPFGHCLCGRAALSAEVEFSSCLDERHEVTYPGIKPHGHYCVPLKSGGRVLGMLNLYLGEGHRRDEEEVRFLTACAGVLAGMVERKRAEEELGKSEARIRAVTDSAQDAILMMDPDGLVSYWNPMAEKVFGYTRQEAIGKNLHEFLAPKRYHGAHHAAYAEFLRTGRGAAVGKTVELEAVRKGGEEISIALSLSAVQLKGEWHAVGIVRDITGDKRRQALALLSRETLDTLNRSAATAQTIWEILQNIQKSTGFEAVGIRLRSGEDFPYFAQNGFSQDFLLTENTLIERGQDGGLCRGQDGRISLECTCGLVLSGKTDPASPLFTPGGSFWTNDSLPLLDLPAGQDPRRRSRNRCIHAGFLSFALVPIRTGPEIVGLLQLNSRKKDRFTLEMVQSFERLAASIGLALMRKQAEEQREAVIVELKEALAQVKTLSGFIPICGHCKKIRDDKGFWESVEKYVGQRSEAKFSHGVCPDCAKKFYGEYYEDPPAAGGKSPQAPG